jgi:hypothetical protein
LNTFLLGLSVALLFYSKYHAVLIVLCVLLSNLRLLRKYHTYIAGLIALLLFAPHLWWQYQHNWVSFRYHLFESNVNSYKPSFTLNYITGQLLLPGPIAGFILLPAAFLCKPKNETEKALRFTLIGVYAFFLFSSFRGKVEGNWTSPVLVCVFILAFQYLNENIRWQKMLFKLLPLSLILVLCLRLITIVDILPLKLIREKYHSWKEWPAIMKEKTKGLPVVFSNSYQRASKYWFYTGQMTYSQNLYKEKRSNYNFWPIEDSMLGKPFYFLDNYNQRQFPDSLKTPLGWIYYGYDSSLASFGKVQIEVAEPVISIKQGDSVIIKTIAKMPPLYYNYILNHPDLQSKIIVGIFNKKGWIKDLTTSLTIQQIGQSSFHSIPISPHLPRGKYYLRFAIGIGLYNPTHNSDKIELIIE